jgi:hypothetical protein
LIAEMQVFLAATGVALMMFLTTGLYRGVRVRRETKPNVAVDGRPSDDRWFDGTGWDASLPDVGIDGDEGCLGAILVVVIWVVFSLLVLGLLAAFVEMLAPVLVIAAASLYWVFYRALRQVLLKSRHCRGRLLASIGYAATYTFLYTGWLAAILMGVAWWAGRTPLP